MCNLNEAAYYNSNLLSHMPNDIITELVRSNWYIGLGLQSNAIYSGYIDLKEIKNKDKIQIKTILSTTPPDIRVWDYLAMEYFNGRDDRLLEERTPFNDIEPMYGDRDKYGLGVEIYSEDGAQNFHKMKD